MTTRDADTSPLDGWMAIVLAAGRGTRMRSTLPKVLHPVSGVPMVRLVCDALREAGFRELVVVTADGDDAVAEHAGPGVRIAVQTEPLGTGHAALAARSAVGDAPKVMIVNADLPLLTAGTLREMAQRHDASTPGRDGPVLTFLTAYLDDPTGYGRVIRRDGHVTGVVEESETDSVTRGVAEVNAGLYAASADWLWPALEGLAPGPRGERYLTSLMRLAVERDESVQTPQVVESNEVLARLFEDIDVPLIRRIHPAPTPGDVDEMRQSAKVAGYTIPKSPTREELQALLNATRGKPVARAGHMAGLRRRA